MNQGEGSTLSGFPAYQQGGSWKQDGQTKLVAQKTVVISALTVFMSCSSTPTAC